MLKIKSCSLSETENIAQNIAKNLSGNEIIAFFGDLGVGKTAFIHGIAKYFKIENEVSSPTFSIINEYQTDKFTIYHFDMYRVNTPEDLESTGFFDYIDSGVMLIEWSENIENFIPKNAIKVLIEKTSYENERIITIEGDENFENTCR